MGRGSVRSCCGGSFEDMDTDPQTNGAHQWSLDLNVQRSERAACSSATGVGLVRAPISVEDVVLTPAHRQPLPGGKSVHVSVLADVRRATKGATLELALFRGMKGGSFSTYSTPIPVGESESDDCRRVRLDVAVPAGVVAMQPFVRLAAQKDDVRAAYLSVDNVRLVAWGTGAAAGRRYDTLEAREPVTVELTRDGPDAGDEPFAHS